MLVTKISKFLMLKQAQRGEMSDNRGKLHPFGSIQMFHELLVFHKTLLFQCI